MKQRIVIRWSAGEYVITDRYHGKRHALLQAEEYVEKLKAHGVTGIIDMKREYATDNSEDWKPTRLHRTI